MQDVISNFDGDWDADCSFCGKPHREHRTDEWFTEAGVKLIDRLPCPEETHQSIKTHVRQANMIRFLVSVYRIGKYLWGRVPFKKEARLIGHLINHAYIGIRAEYYLWRNSKKRD